MNRLIGGVLIAIGILIAGLSGLCSVYLVVSSMPLSMAEVSDGALVLLLFGGVPFVLGLATIWGGRVMLRDGDGESRPGGEQ